MQNPLEAHSSLISESCVTRYVRVTEEFYVNVRLNLRCVHLPRYSRCAASATSGWRGLDVQNWRKVFHAIVVPILTY